MVPAAPPHGSSARRSWMSASVLRRSAADARSLDSSTYLSTYAVAGAAIFSGWAAWSARHLVRLEIEHDERARRDAALQAAQGIVVDMQLTSFTDALRPGAQATVSVINAGLHPVTKARLRVKAGEETWGPLLVGSLLPGQRLKLVTGLRASLHDDADAEVRFAAPDGTHWVATATGPAGADDQTDEY